MSRAAAMRQLRPADMLLNTGSFPSLELDVWNESRSCRWWLELRWRCSLTEFIIWVATVYCHGLRRKCMQSFLTWFLAAFHIGAEYTMTTVCGNFWVSAFANSERLCLGCDRLLTRFAGWISRLILELLGGGARCYHHLTVKHLRLSSLRGWNLFKMLKVFLNAYLGTARFCVIQILREGDWIRIFADLL